MIALFRARGRVQGVGYRAFVLSHARVLDLAGWVRNDLDGTVCGEAEGSPEALEAFRVALRGGPPWAHVSALDWSASPGAQSLPRPFEVRR
ncbi:MAG: acylphosphatase [Acidobacteria bacterium]|nr:acylphosphatase [Acidobacteriota bacterium]